MAIEPPISVPVKRFFLVYSPNVVNTRGWVSKTIIKIIPTNYLWLRIRKWLQLAEGMHRFFFFLYNEILQNTVQKKKLLKLCRCLFSAMAKPYGWTKIYVLAKPIDVRLSTIHRYVQAVTSKLKCSKCTASVECKYIETLEFIPFIFQVHTIKHGRILPV